MGVFLVKAREKTVCLAYEGILYMIGVNGAERKASCSLPFHCFGRIDLNKSLLCSPLAMVFHS